MKMEHIKALKAGEEKGLDHFFQLYYKALCFFANRYVKDMVIAEDIVQEAFIKFWEMRERIRTEATIKNLLYTIARNEAISYLRKQKTQTKQQQQYGHWQANETEGYMLEQMITAETIGQVYTSLAALPHGCRKVLNSLYVEGKGISETAGVMNVSVNTVKSQRARGLKIVKGKLATNH